MGLGELLDRVKSGDGVGTNKRAAALFGVTETTFSRWVQGKIVPDAEHAKTLADLAGCTYEQAVAALHEARVQMGKTGPGRPDLVRRLTHLESRMDRVEAKIDRLLEANGLTAD